MTESILQPNIFEFLTMECGAQMKYTRNAHAFKNASPVAEVIQLANHLAAGSRCRKYRTSK